MRRILIMVLVGANIVVFGAYFFLRNLESAFEDAVAINEEVVDELSATPGAATDPSTFLLIDGVLTSSDGSGRSGNFGELNSDNIGRIEFVKGPYFTQNKAGDQRVCLIHAEDFHGNHGLL